MDNIVAIIPARMGSSRFFGKPLASINGIPMIEHVYRGTLACQHLSGVYVATCDVEIKEHIESIGGQAIMTSEAHERATDRTAEAMLKIEELTGRKVDVVVMVQGDEPMVSSSMIEDAIRPFREGHTDTKVVNLMAPMDTVKAFNDPNEVKVVVNQQNQALYFSREPIPSVKKGGTNIPMLKQVCIIPFTRDYLLKFNDLPQTPLEIIESVDMLRILEHGESVQMIMTNEETYSVDTPEDLAFVQTKMAEFAE